MLNINERQITSLQDNYLIFMDEVGDPFLHRERKAYDDPTIFPVMTVLALIISRETYKRYTVPEITALKTKYFGTAEGVHFHSREIRRKEGNFNIFQNLKIYDEFKNDMDVVLRASGITLISSSINKLELLDRVEKYENQNGEGYNLGDIYLRNVDFVLERLGLFLQADSGKIIFEERGKSESRRIQGVLADAKRDGTYVHAPDRFRNISEDIQFFTKKDDVAGLQLADYCAYPFARHARNPNDNGNDFFDYLRQFVFSGNSGEYGLKEWL